MNNLSPDEQKELWKFMGEMESFTEDFKSFKEDMKVLRKDVQALKLDFANLKGKLVVVAGVVTFSLNAIWSVVKGVIT